MVKRKKDKKHTYKAKDRITRNPLKTGDELRCSGGEGVNSSCSTNGTRRLNHITLSLDMCTLYHIMKRKVKNSDDQQFHQYKQNNHILPQTIEIKNTMKYDVWKSRRWLGTDTQCGNPDRLLGNL